MFVKRKCKACGSARTAINQRGESVARNKGRVAANTHLFVSIFMLLEKKYKNAGKDLVWQWFFPGDTVYWKQSCKQLKQDDIDRIASRVGDVESITNCLKFSCIPKPHGG